MMSSPKRKRLSEDGASGAGGAGAGTTTLNAELEGAARVAAGLDYILNGASGDAAVKTLESVKRSIEDRLQALLVSNATKYFRSMLQQWAADRAEVGDTLTAAMKAAVVTCDEFEQADYHVHSRARATMGKSISFSVGFSGESSGDGYWSVHCCGEEITDEGKPFSDPVLDMSGSHRAEVLGKFAREWGTSEDNVRSLISEAANFLCRTG